MSTTITPAMSPAAARALGVFNKAMELSSNPNVKLHPLACDSPPFFIPVQRGPFHVQKALIQREDKHTHYVVCRELNLAWLAADEHTCTRTCDEWNDLYAKWLMVRETAAELPFLRGEL